MTHAVEIYPDYVVDSNGDARSPYDFLDAEGQAFDVPGPRLVERVPVVEATPVSSTELLKTGPFATKVDDWLDVHRNHDSTSTPRDACNALGIDYDNDYLAEIDAQAAESQKDQADAKRIATGALAKKRHKK